MDAWNGRQLGICPYKYLAEEWGVSKSAVKERRNFLDIEF